LNVLKQCLLSAITEQFLNLGASHFDGIPEDLMEIFDPHWGKFPPQVNMNKIND